MVSTLFTINLALNLLVGFYYMETRSERGLNFFIGYLLIMCVIGFFQNILGNMELALELNIFAIIIFACAVLFKAYLVLRAYQRQKKANSW